MLSDTERLLGHFKALADPVRLRLFVLCTRAECSVTELRAVTGLSQPRVSQHLRQLTDAGLVARFRDGQFAYYRAGVEGVGAVERRRILALIPDTDPVFERDRARLRDLRGDLPPAETSAGDRALFRALVELTVSAPLGNLLDIGSGEGRVLKLLASRARHAVGVDTDPDARQTARRQLLLAGIPNCSLRQGSMYELPFDSGDFDTVILDDVLGDAERPIDAITEARRMLKAGGRLIVIGMQGRDREHDVAAELAAWCAGVELMVGAPRLLTDDEQGWFLAVASHAPPRTAAA